MSGTNGQMQIYCSQQPDGSVQLQCDNAMSLHLEHRDLERALECLDGVLDKPACGITMAGNSFCAFHAADGSYYLLCGDHIILRFTEKEAFQLRYELAAAHAGLQNHSQTRQ
jgi:hypothetical protein